jgi:PAS domain S-box-containing protein
MANKKKALKAGKSVRGKEPGSKDRVESASRSSTRLRARPSIKPFQDELRRTRLELDQARNHYAELFDSAPTAFLNLDARGRITAANRAAASLLGMDRVDLIHEKFTRFIPAEGHDDFRLCQRRVLTSQDTPACELDLLTAKGRRLTVQLQGNAINSPEFHKARWRLALNDITAHKRTEERIAQLNRAQSILAGIDRAIVHIPDRQKLLDAVCRVAVEAGGFKLAWVGMAAPDGSVQPVAQAGAIDYLDGIHVVTRDEPEGRGPIGEAFRENRPVVIDETDQDPRMIPWRDRLRQFGLRYVAAFPIRIAGKMAGTFQFYAPKPGFFDESEVSLLTQVSDDISFALTAISDLAARQQAEDALHAASELNQQMISGAKDGIVVYSRDLKCLIWNPMMEQLMGKPAAEVLGKRPLEVFPSLLANGVMKRLERVLQGETCPEADFLLHSPGSGRAVWVSDTSSTLRNGHGEITGGMSIVREITERKQAEERIAKLNRVQTIMASIDRAIVHIGDRQELLDEICRVAVEAGGFKLAWVGMVAPDGSVRPVAKAGATEYLDSGRVVIRDEPQGRGPTGTAIRENRPVVVEEADQDPRLAPWHHHLRKFGMRYIAAFPIRIAGKVMGSFQVYAPQANFFNETEVRLLTQVSDDISFALTAISDLAARKQAEESLRRSEHNLAGFFNQSPIGLVWLSAGGVILRANQAQLDMLGYAGEDYVGHSFTEFCGEPSRGRELLERLADKKTVRNFRMARRCKDGTIRHVLVDAVSFLADAAPSWSDHQPHYSALFLRDITDRVKLEKEILQTSEQESRRIAQDLHDGLGQLLAGAAHLTGALQKDLAAKSLPEVRQLGRIQDVLSMSIAHTRDLARGLHPVEPAPNGLMAALQTLASQTEKLFHVACHFNHRQPVLIKDNTVATHLFRIAQEAMTNAIKHGNAKRIEISLAGTPERITLAVKDDGAGVPAGHRKTAGMGFRIMRHRAGMIGGSLAIRKEAAGGTAIVCTVHLSGKSVTKSRLKTARKLN